MVRCVTIKAISPVTSLIFIVPMAIACTFYLPSHLIGASLKLWASFRWEVDWITAFVVTTFDVMSSLLLLDLTIRFLLRHTFIHFWAEFLAFRTFKLRSFSFFTVHVVRTRISYNCFRVTFWWANYGCCCAVWIQVCIWWEPSFRIRLRICLFSGRCSFTRLETYLFIGPRKKKWRLNAFKIIFFWINASDEVRTISIVLVDVESIVLRRRTECCFTRCNNSDEKENEEHYCWNYSITDMRVDGQNTF